MKAGTCKYNSANVGGKVSTKTPYVFLTPYNVTVIQAALAKNGLVSAGINANANFMHYAYYKISPLHCLYQYVYEILIHKM